MKQTEKLIEIKNVTISYAQRISLFKKSVHTVLSDINCNVYKGETLGIIGRNGSGKSTLLRLLSGIIRPNKGEATFHTDNISLLSLTAGFDPNLSGRQNALISGMFHGYTKKQSISFLEEIKSYSELDIFFEKPVKTYSSGMLTRLGFSIAQFITPKVLLIDEVLGVGDVGFREKSERSLRERINSDLTVVLVSHSEKQMRSLCDRIIWIDNGSIVASNTPDRIFSFYNHKVLLEEKVASIYAIESQKVYLNNNNYDVFFELFNPSFFVMLDSFIFDNERSQCNFQGIIFNKEDQLIEAILVISEEEEKVLPSAKSSPVIADIFNTLEHVKNARYTIVNNNIDTVYQFSAIINGQFKPFGRFMYQLKNSNIERKNDE